MTGDLPSCRARRAGAERRAALVAAAPAAAVLAEVEYPGAIEFRLGRPFTTQLPADVWRRVWHDVSDSSRRRTTGRRPATRSCARRSPASSGVRGASPADADDVIVTAGAVQALDLIARATLAPGDAVGFEEPGYPIARRSSGAGRDARAGSRSMHDGLQVDRLPAGDDAPMFVYVTPSHQYPLGARMPVGRRVALIEWARANDSLIVEDDYDSEFRFDAPPLPALAGIDESGRVAYIGTFSKVLSPALRVGYLVAPQPLRSVSSATSASPTSTHPGRCSARWRPSSPRDIWNATSAECAGTMARSAPPCATRSRRSAISRSYVVWRPGCTPSSNWIPRLTPRRRGARPRMRASSSRRSTATTSARPPSTASCSDTAGSSSPTSSVARTCSCA